MVYAKTVAAFAEKLEASSAPRRSSRAAEFHLIQV